MVENQKTKQVYNRQIPGTKDEYIVIYDRQDNSLKLYKHFYDDDGKPHRRLIKRKRILDFNTDLNNLRQYISDELIKRVPTTRQTREERLSEYYKDTEWIDIGSKNKAKSEPKRPNNDSTWKPVETSKKDNSTSMKPVDDDQWIDVVPGRKMPPRHSRNKEKIMEIEPCCKTSDLKIGDLESLFTEWEKAHANEPEWLWKITNGGNKNIGKDHFRRDGIIDERVFRNERMKVLFISAEANDNDYSAITQEKTNTVTDYLEFHRTGVDDWGGKMRKHLSEMYKVICGIERSSMPNKEAAIHFAVMDINKRGGAQSMKDGKHINVYCRYYSGFIRREIEIIDPDIVAIIGRGLFNMKLHTEYLGAVVREGKCYFDLNGKQVPILSLYQTSCYQGKNKPLAGYNENKTIGKQAAICVEELKKFGLYP